MEHTTNSTEFSTKLMSMQDKDLLELLEKVNKYRMDILFEEPCPLYEVEDYLWEDYYRET